MEGEKLFPPESKYGQLISYGEIEERLKKKSSIPFASEEDLRKLQGGTPKVYEKIFPNGKKITTIVHSYAYAANEQGRHPVIISHKSLEDYGTVNLDFGETIKEAPVALLWENHGGPCETESLKHGGKGYERGLLQK